jgi:hypothetical protein
MRSKKKEVSQEKDILSYILIFLWPQVINFNSLNMQVCIIYLMISCSIEKYF